MSSIARRLAYLVFATLTFFPVTSLAATFAPSAIAGSVTWDAASGPYVVNSMLDIPSGATLTILPGTVVKFGLFAGMSVEGTLVANDVTFTSLRDDAAGGDTNNDADATTPAAGNWTTILVNQGGTATIVGGEIRYGGQCCFYNATLTNQGGTLTLDGVTMREHLRDALYQPSGTSTISRSYLSALGHGMQVTDGYLEIEGNDFESANAALITGNVHFVNKGANHGKDGYRMWPLVSTPLSIDTHWVADGLPYIIQGDAMVPAGRRLDVDPGAVVKFMFGGSFTNYGTLALDGATFTSFKDDVVLGDTNNDGTQTMPSDMDWYGIRNLGNFSAASATIRYGGQNFNMIRQEAGTSTIDRSDISHANTGIQYLGGSLSLTASNLHDLGWGVYNQTTTDLLVPNNYWGAPSGPVNINTNPLGQGVAVSDHVVFAPWATSDPTVGCTVNCNDNIMFFPGIMGSRLFEEGSDCGIFSGEKERWVSTSDCDHARLALDASGKSVNQLYTKEGADGVIDDTYGSNIYQSFMNDLADWKSDGTINDYALMPYDWRLSLEDILQNGATSSDGSLRYDTSQGFIYSYIYQKLSELTASSRTGKVTIIAHSNGGLVTKALIQKLKDTHDPLYERIDKVIFVAVPQSGTPETIGSLLHGANIGPGGLVISARRVRDLLHNMPFAYNLLPTEKYVGSGIPLIEFEGFSATSSVAKYGASINDIPDLYDYLMGGDGRAVPDYYDLLHAQVVNSSLLSSAHDVHTILDNWMPASTTEVYEIAGWGIYTPMGIKYEPNKLCVASTTTIPVQPGAPQPINCAYYVDSYKISDKMSIDGDGTVMRRSAHQMDSSEKIHRYWLDLAKYNDDNIINRNHKDILEVKELAEFLKSVVSRSIQTNEYTVDNSSSLSVVHKAVKYEIHSPLNLSIYDNLGRHTGISTTTGLVENNVKGSNYYEIGDSKIIVVDASVSHMMHLDAYDAGSFTLDIEELNGDDVVGSTTFMGIPTSTTTKASFEWASGQRIATSTKLIVDYNGDRTPDIELTAKIGDIVLLPAPAADPTPPATIASVSGNMGTNGWYTSDVAVLLNATDPGSGVSSTSYSLDGVVWQNYTAPFMVSKEGTTSIFFYSVDKAGNREATNTLVIKIDKTAPEANIYVSTSTQDILVEGSDGNGMVSIAKDASGSYVLVDQAGHTTRLFFTKTYSGKLITAAQLVAIQYDNAPKIALPTSTFVYLWDIKTSPPTLISQTILASNTYLVQATYDRAKNKTTVVILRKNVPVQTQAFTGLKIIQLTTNRGVVGYSW